MTSTTPTTLSPPAAPTFKFDTRGLPDSLKDAAAQAAYSKAVGDELLDSFGLTAAGNELVYGYITGKLLLQQQFSPTDPSLTQAMMDPWKFSIGKTGGVANRDYFAKVAAAIPSQAGHTPEISYQEFASVVDYVIANASDVPIDDPNLGTQVRIGLDRYVGGPPAADSLDLPPLTSVDGEDDEAVPANIKAFGTTLACYYLERLRLIGVVDRITELFLNGMLPIGFDAAGRALDDYHWNAEDRLSESERRMVYGRVLGVPGAEVSKEVQPNKDFESLFMRFISSLSEYDRQQRLGDLFDTRTGVTGRTLSLTGENVRKTGRDLAANASLYGWGGVQFAARRINAHVVTALDILKQPGVQQAYGVTNTWQVIERVSSRDFGEVPNIVKYRTMAESGKAILDVVAKYAGNKVWSSSGLNSLFDTSGNDTGDIKEADREALMRHAEHWLAVTGTASDQVDKLSQPSDTSYAPSLPSFDGIGGKSGGAASSNGAGATVDRLRQMVSSGATPTLDQLQQLLH